jgi:hypothetical protein
VSAAIRKILGVFTASHRLAAVIFFALLLACGLLIYRDYGVSWDEPTQLRIGVANYRYATRGDPALLSMRDRFYGPLFEMFLVRFQSKGDDQAVYYSRHLLTFLCFYAGCLAFYFLARRFLGNKWAALGAVVFLALSPRIFADAFYNTKDIPFMVFYIFGLLTLLWFLDRPTLPRLAIHAAFSAALIDVRLPGLVLPALTLGGLALEVLARRISLSRALAYTPLYLAITAGLTLSAWPALWPDPLGGFKDAWGLMSHFPQITDMLYLGQKISTLKVPWHYIPVWLSITTPLLYLALFVLGLGIMSAWLIRAAAHGPAAMAKGKDPQTRNDLLVLGALFAPLLAVMVMKSVLYDAWRQMFFIYPPFLLVAARGLLWAWQTLAGRWGRHCASGIGGAALAIGLLPTLAWMAANHPFQNLYFNRLAGPNLPAIQQRFELDYWGLAYRKGLEFLVKAQKEGAIRVFMETAAGRAGIPILPAQDAERIKIVDNFTDADYFIANYYLHPGPYPLEHEVYTLRVSGAPILSVFSVDALPGNQEKNK